MLRPDAADTRLTFEEFLAFEEAAELKHELVDGFVYPWPGYETDPATGLAGATDRHNAIVMGLVVRLFGPARARGCRLRALAMRLRVSEDTSYYPDLQVVCDATDRHELYTERPCLIVEVLSRGTQRIDRGEKWGAYRRLASLESYLLVWQDRRRVEHYRRQGGATADRDFAREEVIGSGSVHLACLDTDLTLDDIYGPPCA
jgi:Uma2 family endonuclease